MDEFIVSFSFDDVPVSAATCGAACLARHDVLGTWYVATGLVGGDSVSGRIVEPAQIRELAAAGHEIAMHGHDHADMSRLPPDEALADIARNREILALILDREPSPHFAYPYGTTSIALKRHLPDVVSTARGVLPGVNRAGSDAMQLSAFDLRRDPATVARACIGMERAARHGGWAILFTHDVAPDPSPFGIRVETLDTLLGHASRLGGRILPVGAAWNRLRATAEDDQST